MAFYRISLVNICHLLAILVLAARITHAFVQVS